MSRQARNLGRIPNAVIAVDPSPLPAQWRGPLTVRSIFNSARWPHWLHFDRRDFGLAFTLAAAGTVINTLGSLRVLSGSSLLGIVEYAANMFFGAMLMAVALVVTLEMLERFPIRGWRRHVATVATGAITTLVVAGPLYVFEWPFAPSGVSFGVTSSVFALLLYTAWSNSALALIARAWLVKSREETHAINLLTRLRSEQTSARRRLVEGRLQAIQARIDPPFFFDMLDAVQKTYLVDAARAEQLLDELSAFLRAALPRLRTTSSSVDQECELASSFARLRALAGLGRSRLDIDIAPSVGTATFPSGVLLPLVDELLGVAADADSVGLSFLIHAEKQPESASRTVIMHLTARQQPSDKALARTRATLFDLFGATASIAGIAVDGGARTTLEVPYEPANA